MAFEMVGQIGLALATLVESSIQVLPGIIAALIVVILGYLIAAIVGWVVEKLLEKSGIDLKLQKVCKTEMLGRVQCSSILGLIVKWYVFIAFLAAAVELVHLGVLTGFLQTVVNWLPNLIVAVLLVLLGLILADYVDKKIQETRIKGAELVARTLYIAIMLIIGVISLNQIGIDVSLLQNLILLVVGAIAVGVALALGISLGLGLKDDAKKFVKDFKR